MARAPEWSSSARLGRVAGLALVFGALASCGSSTRTITQTTTETRVTTTVTAALGPTTTVTVTAGSATAPANSATFFSGVGTKSVGTIDAPLNSTLDWTCSGDCRGFAITNNPNDTGTIALRASGMSGSTPIVAGTYHDVRVITGGRWTFTIVPAGGP